jgi:hypothetical protein
VLEEQLYVDWLFKTSFLNVKNNFRELTQRKTYTVGADSYVEEYIKEVKPFHTKLREYRVGYRKTEVDDGCSQTLIIHLSMTHLLPKLET